MLSSAINTHGKFLHMQGHPSQASIDGQRWYTKEGPSASSVNKRNTPAVRQGKAYEDDVIPGDANESEIVDLHTGEFCVDVSTFGPVEYDTSPAEVCDSTFAKQCEDRYEEVISSIKPSLYSKLTAFQMHLYNGAIVQTIIIFFTKLVSFT